MVPTEQVEAPQLTLVAVAPSAANSSDDSHEPSSPEADGSGTGTIHGKENSVARAGAGNDDEDDEDDDENERCRRLARTTVHVLDNVLELRYGTPDHPSGEPNKLFTFGCTGGAGNYQYQIRVEPEHFIVTCSSPLRIPSDQRAKVAEFIARVNFTIILGHFDMDFSDGELRFRLVQHTVPSLADEPALLAKFFAVAHKTMDMHFGAIMRMT